jgi:HSP20 family molecular chaperone IbpA
MAQRFPTDWMWAQACEVIEEAERMHRQFFRLAATGRTRATWEPPVDVFEDEHEIVVLVALPGVPAHRVEVTAEAGELVVRAERSLPFPASRGSLRRLEIPYGYFERRIHLPGMRIETATREVRDGCLILRLGKREGA